jgi:hypothetical protein
MFQSRFFSKNIVVKEAYKASALHKHFVGFPHSTLLITLLQSQPVLLPVWQ